MVTNPTRVTNTCKTTIDHIVTNNTDFYHTAFTFDPGLSDHQLVGIARKRLKLKHTTSYFRGRSYRNFDEDMYYADMAKINWTFLYQIDDVNIAAEIFTDTMLGVIDKHALYKRIKCCSDQPKWVNSDFLSLIDEKNHRCNVYNRRPNQLNAAKKREATRRVKQMKRYLRRTYIEDSIQNTKDDPKKLWRTIKSIWPSKNKSTTINSINGNDDAHSMANTLNTHFSTVGSNLADTINTRTDQLPTFTDDAALPQLTEINIDDVWKLICTLSPSKATGLDGIPARLIKLCGHLILSPLHYIFNLSIKTLTFPQIWKEAQITPLFKGGNQDQPDNYRPISVLPIFSKLLERLVHNQIYDVLTVLGALTDSQAGFRKGHSTTTCLVEFLDVLYKHMDDGKVSGVLFLDLRKAFDTVDHEIVLRKLEVMGLGLSYVLWIKDYLYNRHQVTKVNHIVSDKHIVTCGVPQGSILGPLLFILYINSLPNAMPSNIHTFLYADDTALVTTGDSMDTIERNLNASLILAKQWFDNHKLSLNVKKTKGMKFGTKQKLSQMANLKIAFDSETVEQVYQFKYLGVILDCSLQFDKHVAYVKQKVYTRLKTLGRLRQFISRSLSLTLYRSLVLPHFNYADVCYDSMSKSNANQLQSLQNTCLRICLKREKMSNVHELHTDANVCKLSDRRKAHCCNLVYLGVEGKSTKGINNMFSLVNESHKRTTRASSEKTANHTQV